MIKLARKHPLPKTPFILSAFALMAIALLMLFLAKPLSSGMLFWAFLTATLGAACAIIPYFWENIVCTEEARMDKERLILMQISTIDKKIGLLEDICEKQAQQTKQFKQSLMTLDSLANRIEERLRSQGECASPQIVDFAKQKEALKEQANEIFEQEEFNIEFEMDEDLLEGDTHQAEIQGGGTVRAFAQLGVNSHLYLVTKEEQEGIRLEHSSPGVWEWTIQYLDKPLEFEIYKNRTLADSRGPYVLNPGETLEIHPQFK